jgi:DnaK suppressor protein
VKPQPKAAAKAQKNKPVKTTAKAKPSTKAKPAAKAKPLAKAAPKAAAKKVATSKKAAPKTAPKKVAPLKTTKPAASNAKTPAKAVKPAAKSTKPVAKAAKAATKATKPATKPAAKAAPKAAKPAAKATPAAKKSAAPQPAKAAPKASTAPAAKKSAASPVPVAPSTPVAAAPAGAVPGSTPPRATRPSARLVQITVPSMAQSVASTAAKASYIQTPAPAVFTPPPSLPVKKDPKLANNWKTKQADQLTDAEVLAMPDGEYMNDKQMAFFRLKLLQLKQDILNSAGETTEHLREDTVIVPDPADRATIEEEHALELRTRDRERKLLKKIEQSIARIDAGDYGYCDETGEPIGVGRLLARPTATLSLEAQQRRELKQKMFGD